MKLSKWPKASHPKLVEHGNKISSGVQSNDNIYSPTQLDTEVIFKVMFMRYSKSTVSALLEVGMNKINEIVIRYKRAIKNAKK